MSTTWCSSASRTSLFDETAASGLASAAFGTGMVAGALALIGRQRLSAAVLWLLGLALTAIGALLTGIAPGIAAVVAFQLIAGSGNGIDNVANETLLQQCVPRAMLGRVFGLTNTAANAGAGLAYLLGGVLLDLTSPRAVLIIAGIGGLAVTAAGIPALMRARDTYPGDGAEQLASERAAEP